MAACRTVVPLGTVTCRAVNRERHLFHRGRIISRDWALSGLGTCAEVDSNQRDGAHTRSRSRFGGIVVEARTPACRKQNEDRCESTDAADRGDGAGDGARGGRGGRRDRPARRRRRVGARRRHQRPPRRSTGHARGAPARIAPRRRRAAALRPGAVVGGPLRGGPPRTEARARADADLQRRPRRAGQHRLVERRVHRVEADCRRRPAAAARRRRVAAAGRAGARRAGPGPGCPTGGARPAVAGARPPAGADRSRIGSTPACGRGA